MLIGAGTSAKLQIVTSAAADIEVSGSKVVVDQSSPPVVDGTNTGAIILASITTATTTDAVTGIASKTTRVDELQAAERRIEERKRGEAERRATAQPAPQPATAAPQKPPGRPRRIPRRLPRPLSVFCP